ncbi:hypothetical protein ANCDUO_25491 [Ancylostoma duodenale]|uniref:Uncharacterized protein n=1 Tax=Ancylostoma duodenale TaxID=51022 RepID=A0A0C2BL38_9BILA|nr:hypothetical protein ANCDUO_25491 [Ancylostoma duodenale]
MGEDDRFNQSILKSNPFDILTVVEAGQGRAFFVIICIPPLINEELHLPFEFEFIRPQQMRAGPHGV